MQKPKRNLSVFLILIIFLCKVSFCKAQLKADFTSSVQSGCSPVVVQFTDASTGNPTSWFWDLGNGTTSTLQNPGVIYLSPGKYSVKLVVKNSTNKDSVVKKDYITVNAKPNVAFTAVPNSGCAPLLVFFTDNSNGSGGTITNHLWDFGDGTTSTVANPSHTYTVQNTFDVSLTVTNSFGCRQTLLQQNVVVVGGIVKADFSYTYTSVCKPPATVTFKNLSTASGTLAYQWYFGDGASSTVKDPVHSYATSGTFKVMLVARNSSGCTDTSKQTVTIGGARADFNYTKNVCINEPVFFSDTSSPKPKSVTWNFGDGKTGNGLNVSHVYTSAGTYQVTEIADFGGCSDVAKKNIVITGKPKASFTTTGTITTCQYPTTIKFNNTSTGAVSYEWQFGDGTISTSASPSHTYTAPGFYSVTLVAFNTSGCSDTTTINNLIQLGPPQITGITNLPANGCRPLSVTMHPQIVSPEPIVSYQWSFGDGSFSNASDPTHIYNKVGGYTVKLVVTTASGCEDSLIITDAVLVGDKPTANFGADLFLVCAQDGIQFTDSSKGNITDWLWDFGDGGSSTEQNPLHQFADTGYHTIKLTVSSNGCSDSITFIDYVYIKPPVALYDFSSDCLDPYLINFHDSSIAPQTWLWDFGDGTTSTIPSPSHRYSSAGIYYISLTVTNGACSYITRDTLDLFDENPLFDYVPLQTNFCKYDSVQFFVISYTPAHIQSYYWDFGDSTNTGFGANLDTVYHIYTAAGTYTPHLIVLDTKGCYDTVTNSSVQLKISGPVAAFSNEIGDCFKTQVVFKDESYSDVANPIQQWIWNYGDNSYIDTLTNGPFNHIYDSTGLFDVSLKVTDIYGCSDSITNSNAIQITNPRVFFSSSQNIFCSNSVVQFKDSSFGISLDYKWNFGDGDTSVYPDPLHTYINQGVYDVSLKITDKYGCADSVLKPQYITISDPIAEFINPDTIFQCPPSTITPQNTSSGYSSLLWDFGDGNTSSEINPVHIYTQGGTYTLKLIAYGYGACIDSVSKPLVLKGPQADLYYSPFSGCNPLQVSFSAKSKNATAFTWDFGNGVTQSTSDSSIIYTYTVPGRYVPKLVVTDAGGCIVAVENIDTILVYGVSAKYGVVQNTSTCDSIAVNFVDSSIVFTNDKIVSILWDFGDGTSTYILNPTHIYKTSGTYNTSLTISTQNGCASTYTLPVPVLVHYSPKISAVIPDSACALSNVSLNASLTQPIPDPVSWVWYTGYNNDTLQGQNSTYSYPDSGIYNVRVTANTNYGCGNFISEPIKINPIPLTDAGPDSVICLGQTLLLQPSGAQSYRWTNNVNLSCTNCVTPLAAPPLTDTFYVTGSNNYGCQSLDSVIVEVKQPANILVTPNDTICIGNSVHIKATGAELFSWQPPTGLSDPFSGETTAAPLFTTNYTVTGTDSKGCFTDSKSVLVNVYNYPKVILPDSAVTLDAGSQYQIFANGSPDIVSWQWAPPEGLSCNACPQPVAKPRTNTTYTVSVKNIAGCETKSSITFQVLCKGQSLFIPNTFSPNNDGVNDYFYPRGTGLFSVQSFRVFNRWGKIVYERTNFLPNNESYGWNGKYNGIELQPDVYVYVIEVLCDNGTVLFNKGNVTLLR